MSSLRTKLRRHRWRRNSECEICLAAPVPLLTMHTPETEGGHRAAEHANVCEPCLLALYRRGERLCPRCRQPLAGGGYGRAERRKRPLSPRCLTPPQPKRAQPKSQVLSELECAPLVSPPPAPPPPCLHMGSSLVRRPLTPTRQREATGASFAHLQRLLEQGRVTVGMVDGRGNTLLHVEARRGDSDKVRVLLAFGASVSARTLRGETPLHAAVLGSGSVAQKREVIRLLVHAGANVNATMNDGRTAVDLASDFGVLELLRQAGGRRSGR